MESARYNIFTKTKEKSLRDGFTSNICESSATQISGSSLKIVSEYNQEIPQSQTTDNPMARRGKGAQPSQDTRKTNYVKHVMDSS